MRTDAKISSTSTDFQVFKTKFFEQYSDSNYTIIRPQIGTDSDRHVSMNCSRGGGRTVENRLGEIDLKDAFPSSPENVQ